MEDRNSFLSGLIAKEAYVRGVQDKTKKTMGSVIGEVKRQIDQSVKNGNEGIFKGVGVTKSGGND